MRSRTIIVAIAALLPAVAPSAAQTTILVPTNGVASGCASAIGSALFCGQTFVVPVGDDVLQSFSYTVSTTDALTFHIYAASGTDIVGGALYSQAFGPTVGFETLVFTPAGGLALVGGGEYAALVRMGSSESVSMRANDADPYADGVLLLCSGGAAPGVCQATPTDWDYAFEATFVSPHSTVPEPATLALTGGGLLLIGGLAHRRRMSR